MTTFFLAMARYPSVLERAQRELDAVVGNDRLPSFEDRPHLPYVNAIISELLRWQPVTPMGRCSLECSSAISDGLMRQRYRIQSRLTTSTMDI